MRRSWVVVVALVALGLMIWAAVLAAPTQARNWEYCTQKGGIYLTKSWQCVSKDGIENMLGK